MGEAQKEIVIKGLHQNNLKKLFPYFLNEIDKEIYKEYNKAYVT